MQPSVFGTILLVVGVLQSAGGFTKSRIFQALPHFQRTAFLFGKETALIMHGIFGAIVAIAGVLVLTGVIELPKPKPKKASLLFDRVPVVVCRVELV